MHFFHIIFMRCILIGPIVKQIVCIRDLPLISITVFQGRFNDLKCPVLWDIIALAQQLQSFTAGWYLQALALSTHTLNWTMNRVRQSDVHRSIATGNHRRLLVALFVQCTLHFYWVVNKRNGLCGDCVHVVVWLHALLRQTLLMSLPSTTYQCIKWNEICI